MQRLNNCLIAIFVVFIFGVPALAALPQTINYQGYLKSSDGTPVNSAVDVTFALYAAESGGAALWSETRGVTPENGVYSVQLGSAAPFPANLFTNDNLFLGVKVANETEMTPRRQFTPVPYAIRAVSADTAGGVAPGSVTDSAITGPISDGKLSANVALLGNAQTVTGVKTFTPSGSSAPFVVAAGKSGMVANLNTEMVGGQKLADLDNRYVNPAQPRPTTAQVATLRWDQVGNGVSGTYAAGSNPAGILFDGNNLWVASYTGANNLTKINPASGAVLANYAVAGSHVGIAFDGTSIWVANRSGSSVSKVNPSNGAILGTYTVGANPWGIAFDGTSIWVANNGSLSVSKINPSSGAILGTYNVGNNPRYIAYDGTNIWVTNNGSNSVTKLNTSGAALGTYTVGTGPEGIAFDGTSIWVANWGSSNVTKLNPATGTVLGAYPVGTGPAGIAFDGTHIWVGNYSGNSLSKLNPGTGAVLGTFATGTNPWGIAFDGANIWSANWGSSNLTKLANVGVQIGSQSVGTAQLATAAVSTTQLADMAVATAKLADAAVTGSKLADGSVASVKLADGSVTSAKLAGGAVTSAKIYLDENVSLNHNDLKLLYGDTNHGLGWYGAGKLFSGANVDGPALYGYSGGALGTTNGGQKIALSWNSSGNVSVPAKLSAGPGQTGTPIAYGVFASDGTRNNGSANMSCTWVSGNSWYECVISGEEYHFLTHITNVTPVGAYSLVVPATSSVAGHLLVILFNNSGNKVQSGFAVTVYRP